MSSGNSDNQTIKYGLNKCYKLVNNINLADGYSETGYWIPIATGDGNGFTGNFDGNGYTVYNLNVTGTREYAGLFGCVNLSGEWRK